MDFERDVGGGARAYMEDDMALSNNDADGGGGDGPQTLVGRCCMAVCVGTVSCLIWACVPVYDLGCMMQEWCCDVEARTADRSVPRRHRTRRPRVWRNVGRGANDPLLQADREPQHDFHALPTQDTMYDGVDDDSDDELYRVGGGGRSELGTQLQTLPTSLDDPANAGDM